MNNPPPPDPLAALLPVGALFTHKYDIDTILEGLCASAPAWLNTQTGFLTADEPVVPTRQKFLLEPLPASFWAALPQCPETRYLQAEDVAQLHTLGGTQAALAPMLANPTRLGGWVRERVKEAALEWLEVNNILPPSMGHITRRKGPPDVINKIKITAES